MWDRDEPRNAGCAREMMHESWIVPTFNGELRALKPPLFYWALMLSFSVLGVSEFAARFWSAILAVGTALLTFHLGKHLLGARVGFLAALILVTNLMFMVSSRAATQDSLLTFLTTGATLVFARHVTAGRRLTSGGVKSLGLVYLLLALATLAKGPVGLLLPGATMGLFLALQGPWL